MIKSSKFFVLIFIFLLTDLNHQLSVNCKVNSSKATLFNFLSSTNLQNSSKLFNTSNLHDSNLLRLKLFDAIKKIDQCSKLKTDYLVLNLNWPVNICARRACIPSQPQKWLIHSLSPVYNLKTRQLITQCCNRPFNFSELGSVMSELKENWFSVLAIKSDEDFWEEEWLNNGACLGSNEKLATISKFFAETIRLFKEINLEKFLADENITPSDDIKNFYEFKSFYQAIYQKRPYKFQVVCDSLASNPLFNSTISIIDSINLCFDKNLQSTNCPPLQYFESNCKEIIFYPTVQITDLLVRIEDIEAAILEKKKRKLLKSCKKYPSHKSDYLLTGADLSYKPPETDLFALSMQLTAAIG